MKKNIWCGRQETRYFGISRIGGGWREGGEGAWLIYLFGYALWIGPGRPSFLNRKEKK